MSNKLKALCITGITAVTILIIAIVILFTVRTDDGADGSDNVSEADAAEKNTGNRYTSIDDNDVSASEAPEATDSGVRLTADSDVIINSNMEYILQKQYVSTDSGEKLEEEKLAVPAEFVALDRTKLQNYLDSYIDDMPLEEYLDGLIDFEIIELNKDKLVLRKTYGTDWNTDKFFLCENNGEIVVYYSDKKTVFEYTGIPIDSIGEEEQLKIRLGYFVSDEEELYALLESYSS